VNDADRDRALARALSLPAYIRAAAVARPERQGPDVSFVAKTCGW
jgi:hypothetical protein